MRDRKLKIVSIIPGETGRRSPKLSNRCLSHWMPSADWALSEAVPLTAVSVTGRPQASSGMVIEISSEPSTRLPAWMPSWRQLTPVRVCWQFQPLVLSENEPN